METENSSKKKPVKKIVMILAIVLLAFALITLLAIPSFMSSKMGKGFILGKINNNLSGQANYNNLSMSWLKGIKVTNISFKDHKGLIDVMVKQLSTKPKYTSFLTGAISLGKTVIDEPVVRLMAPGEVDQTLPRKTPAEKYPAETDSKIVLPVKRLDLTINNGLVDIKSPDNKTTQFSNINSVINLRSLGQVSSVKLNADISGSQGETSTLEASANVTPDKKTGWSFKGSDGDLNIKLDNLDLASLESLLSLADIDLQAKGHVSGDLNSSIKDGQIADLKGTLDARKIDITGEIINGDHIQTDQANITIDMTTDKDVMNIKNLAMSSDWANAQIKGAVPKKLSSIKDILSTDSSSLNGNFDFDVATILTQMPKTIGIRDGLVIETGKLTGNIETKTLAGKRIISGQADLTDLAGKLDATDIRISQPIQAKINLSSDDTRIYYDNIDIISGFCKINCSGTSELLNYNADINLEKLQAELGQFMETKQNFTGMFTSKGQIQTEPDKITAKGSSQITNLVITTPERTASEPSANIDFAVVMDNKQNILNVNSLKVDAVKLGKINVENGSLPLGKDSTAPTSLKVTADIDLASVQPFAALSGALPEDLLMEGKAYSVLSVNSVKNVYHITTNSTHIDNLKIQKKDKQPFEQTSVDIKFDTTIDADQMNIEVKTFELISPQIKITQGQFKQQTSKAGIKSLSGNANCQYDWQAISNISSQFLPQGFSLKGQRNDTFKFNSTYPADKPDLLMANLNSSLNTGFDSADYMGFYFGKTEVSVDIKTGVMSIKPFSSTVNKGTLNFAGSADFNQKPSLLKTPNAINIFKDIQINDETTKKLLTYVNPIFANAVNVTGIMNFNCDKMVIPLTNGSTKDIAIEGTMEIAQLRLQASNVLSQILDFTGISQQQIITIKPTKFTVADEILKYDDMAMEVGQYPLNFKARSINIGASKKMDVDVILPLTSERKLIKIGEATTAQRMTVPITGTVNKPAIDLNKLMESQLKQQLDNALQDVLKDVFKK